MGEQQVQLIEKNVANNTDDIRELKEKVEKLRSDVTDLRSSSQLMQQSQTHLMENISELKTGLKALGDKWEEKWEKEKEDEAKRYEQERRDQRNRWWGLAFLLIGAMLLMQLGLK
ncbi:hypothetical protein [Sediminibacillus massiliensis]|uniref:hypothetical protein n=1 Tax=Sediminibacillus massiliensis TaxID=1926277 RepID=UPI00098833AB|nr:hypothetical protein [Sediminibacillus massiliensis]